MSVNGILNVYKEKGYTSHDVAAKLRGILKTKKTGHTGTLDPEAQGVLPIGTGTGTKLCDMLTDGDKEYVARMIMGITTDTEDMTGTVLSSSIPDLTGEEIISSVMYFEGEYMQTPPMYSALKVNGKRLYQLAREGKVIERDKRPVNIRELEIISMDKDSEGRDIIEMRVLCSKGTYIRSLCRDIGEKAGCGAAMASLIRTKAAGFRIEEARKLSEIEDYARNNRLSEIIVPVDKVLDYMPAVYSKGEGDTLLSNGNHLLFKHISGKSGWDNGEKARVYNSNNEFFGVYEFDAIKGRFKPFKMFISK